MRFFAFFIAIFLMGSAFAQNEAPPINDAPPRNFKEAREQQDLQKRFPLDMRLTVTALNGKEVTLSDKPVLTFSKASQRLSGFGGCNQVGGDYRVSPRQVRFGPLSFTTKKCGDDATKQEIAIYKAIQFSTHWKPVGINRITLTGQAGNVTLAPAF
jgi:heat shock protein HslJ